MTDTFTGNPAPLHIGDYERAARHLGCSVAAIRAVAFVESAGGGFLADRRPKILFERHVFHARTAGRYGADFAAISSARSGGYLGGAREYERLAQAIRLDRKAALESASWGKFQIMGFNHAACGHDDVESFVTAMVSGEAAQLDAFVAFLRTSRLNDELIRRDWSGFAKGYNGPAFARNAYDLKIAEAYSRFSSGDSITDRAAPVLRAGDTGPHVSRLQTLLNLAADGLFGPSTKAAVMAFQKARHLITDGVVGAATWNALLR